MSRVGPFEGGAHLAVAVSGGGDSMALALLAADWARRQGGEITAITIDHGLRPESAAEARQVGVWLKARGIRHRILRWRPAGGGRGGVQAAARDARYELLTGWCRDRGALHLALAHQLEDQAETLLLRLARGSGLDGLAAMAPIAERDGVRIIRPLLPVPRARLRATLERSKQRWIEDPSNENAAHARVRMRRIMPSLAAEGLDAARLVATAAHLGRARAAVDDAVAALLAAAAAAFPAGYVRLEPRALRAASPEIGLRALSHCLVTVGGGAYAPRLERLQRLYDRIRGDELRGGATLAGCRLLPRQDMLLICREPSAATAAQPIRPGETVSWDGRFSVRLAAGAKRDWAAGFQVRRLGLDGWARLAARRPELRSHPIPPAVRPSLPALWRQAQLVAVPHLDVVLYDRHMRAEAVFTPRAALAPSRFTVA